MSGIINTVINCCNAVISAIGFILQSIIMLLPDSPFNFIMEASFLSDFSANLGWILPISECISTLELWIAAIIVYYCYQGVMRWIKMIE